MSAIYHDYRRYRQAAEALFDLLDDIDIADDMHKGNHEAYRRHVCDILKKRFNWLRPVGSGGHSLRLTQPSELVETGAMR